MSHTFFQQSKKKISFATCTRYPEISDRLISRDDLLAEHLISNYDVQITGCPWNDPDIQWDDFDLVIVRSTWDYCQHIGEFRAWLKKLDNIGASVQNSLDVINWNVDKKYLLDLQRKGVKTIDTVYVSSNVQLKDIMVEKNWQEVVIKPSIGCDSYRTFKVPSVKEASLMQNEFEAMVEESECLLVQKYLPSILTKGEWSVIYLDGNFSHVVNKHPTSDFRSVTCQEGDISYIKEPPAELLEAAKGVVSVLEWKPLYARIDFLQDDDDGVFKLIELELTEPALYLGFGPQPYKYFAKAIMESLQI